MHLVFSITFYPPSRSFPINSPASPWSSELTPSSPSLLMKSICCCWQLAHLDKSTSMLSIVLCGRGIKFPGERPFRQPGCYPEIYLDSYRGQNPWKRGQDQVGESSLTLWATVHVSTALNCSADGPVGQVQQPASKLYQANRSKQEEENNNKTSRRKLQGTASEGEGSQQAFVLMEAQETKDMFSAVGSMIFVIRGISVMWNKKAFRQKCNRGV